MSEGISYMSVNQREYDTVLSIVNEAIKGNEKRVIGGEDSEYFNMFLNGERGTRDRSDPNERTERNIDLIFAENRMGDLVDAGVSKKEIIRIIQTAELADSIQYSGPSSWSYSSYSNFCSVNVFFLNHQWTPYLHFLPMTVLLEA